MLQTHNAAVSGLKGLAVSAVHSTKANMDHRGFRLYISSLFRYTEYLGKMQLLALVCNINIFYRRKILFSLQNRSQI